MVILASSPIAVLCTRKYAFGVLCVALLWSMLSFSSVANAQSDGNIPSLSSSGNPIPLRLPQPSYSDPVPTPAATVGTGVNPSSTQYGETIPESAFFTPVEESPNPFSSAPFESADTWRQSSGGTPTPLTQTFFSGLPANRYNNLVPQAGNAMPDYAAVQDEGFWYHYDGLARSYINNNQRIEFTGQEMSFAVEGVFRGGVHHQSGGWDRMIEGELFFNEPFDKNILVDTPERRSFAGNFAIDPLQISQLYLGARKEDFFMCIGRVPTPFGRYYYSNYLNNFSDSPFIRSEAILYRETGALLQWDPEGYVFTGAITNGQLFQDTNSSKAMMGRAGIDRKNFALGASFKWQDGIGSETQKLYNNHVGVDMMVRRGRWTLSGEWIYDQYGFRRDILTQNEIFWGRSLYYRDINKADGKPTSGSGYYVNLGYRSERWDLQFAYGDYFPEQLGIVVHDAKNHRGLLKASHFFTRNFELYSLALIENTIDLPFENRRRYGIDVTLGAQFSL